MKEVSTCITIWCLSFFSFFSFFSTSPVDAGISVSLFFGSRRLSRFNGFVYSMGYLSLFRTCFSTIFPPHFHNRGGFSLFPPILKYRFLHPHFSPVLSVKEGYYLLFFGFLFFIPRCARHGRVGLGYRRFFLLMRKKSLFERISSVIHVFCYLLWQFSFPLSLPLLSFLPPPFFP